MTFGRYTLIACLLVLAGCSSQPSKPDLVDAGSDAGETTDAGQPPVCTIDFKNGQGLPCNRDADCEAGHCYFAVDPFGTGEPVNGVCTVTCDFEATTNPCPTGYDCVPATTGDDGVCAPYESWPSGNGALAQGAPCATDGDCASGTCARIDNVDGTYSTYCTKSCTDAAACGECSACVPETLASTALRCQPQGPGAIGTQCETRADCASFDCRSFCTQECGGPNGVLCPAGAECTAVQENGRRVTLCLTPAQLGGTANGDPCRYDVECQSGSTCQEGVCAALQAAGSACTTDGDCGEGLKCRDLSPEISVCTRDCSASSCGDGEKCVAFDMDTNLRLLGSNGQEVARNDSINPDIRNMWSEIRWKDLAAGTYFVEVKAYGKTTGAYQLEFLTGSGTPAAVQELAGAHPGTSTAQAVTLPAVVAATFSATGELDYYKFTLQSTTSVVLRTGRGAPSACLPLSSVGELVVGETCSADFECASSQCEPTLQLCTQPCVDDGECGTGNKCVPFGSRLGCVPEAIVGAKEPAPSVYCYWSFECKGELGYCAIFRGSGICTQTCAGPEDPCAILAPGEISPNECAAFDDTRYTPSETKYACVPKGDGSGGVGSPCEIQSDCDTGLSCVNRFCN